MVRTSTTRRMALMQRDTASQRGMIGGLSRSTLKGKSPGRRYPVWRARSGPTPLRRSRFRSGVDGTRSRLGWSSKPKNCGKRYSPVFRDSLSTFFWSRTRSGTGDRIAIPLGKEFRSISDVPRQEEDSWFAISVQSSASRASSAGVRRNLSDCLHHQRTQSTQNKATIILRGPGVLRGEFKQGGRADS